MDREDGTSLRSLVDERENLITVLSLQHVSQRNTDNDRCHIPTSVADTADNFEDDGAGVEHNEAGGRDCRRGRIVGASDGDRERTGMTVITFEDSGAGVERKEAGGRDCRRGRLVGGSDGDGERIGIISGCGPGWPVDGAVSVCVRGGCDVGLPLLLACEQPFFLSRQTIQAMPLI